MMIRWSSRRSMFYLVLLSIITFCIYQRSQFKSGQEQSKRIRSKSINSTKVSIAHYTPLYQIRTNSQTKIFNENLEQICQILDPDDYIHADHVFVSLVDWIDLPDSSYRTSHQSQLWIVYSEESPRNSYEQISKYDRDKLDHWFNLTATLKPESDFHVQYRGYRIKPKIGELIEKKFQINLKSSFNYSFEDLSQSSSKYLNTLSTIFHHELVNRQKIVSNLCPYTCNRPLPSDLLRSIQPYLSPIQLNIRDRNIVSIAWFVSNCNTHSRREQYVAQLRSQKNIHIDIFGSCKSNLCQKGSSNCMEKILSNYRFYLSFENSKCDTYITEKYWIQGLNSQLIPIVLGAKKEQYERIAVPNSFIHVDDFPSIEQLAKELHRLNRNDTAYSQYLQWTQLYDISKEYNSTPGIDLHSTLCFLGYYQRLHAFTNRTKSISNLMTTIRFIFNLTNIHLPNFNWLTAKTNSIKLSQFYNPKANCWDREYPSIFERVWSYFFLW